MFFPLHFKKWTVETKNDGDVGSVKTSFDALLFKSLHKHGQYKLTILLRINLRRVQNLSFNQQDTDGNKFLVTPWTDAAWQRFLQGAQAQVDRWNNKFWLLPPPTLAEFDVEQGGTQIARQGAVPRQVFRPNIRCELLVDFSPKGDAHRTVDVVNIELMNQMAKLQGGNANFRSHSNLYSSMDTIPQAYWTSAGQLLQHTITHEIGHAIGLAHIGVLQKTVFCNIAINAENQGVTVPPDFTGGTNALVCYGAHQGRALAENIMGEGDALTIDDGKPWIWAINAKPGSTVRSSPFDMMSNGGPRQNIVRHFERTMWRVTMKDPGPGTWLKL